MADVAAPPALEKEKSALEKEMEALLGATSNLMSDTKKTQGEAAKVRRKSKDLEESLDQMASASDKWNALGGRRSRRGSRDYSDEAMQEAFKKIDKDGSGYIDGGELEAAIKAMDPNISKKTCTEMMDFADKDGDRKVSFEEYKKILLYKPSSAGAPPAAP